MVSDYEDESENVNLSSVMDDLDIPEIKNEDIVSNILNKQSIMDEKLKLEIEKM